jgi:DNA polymerase III subunit delta'
MTIEAANALLKTLQDPPDHCLFLLISSRPEHLLPTIRSRCMTLRFAPLSLTETFEFLTKQPNMESADARLLAAYSEGRIGMALRITPEEVHIQLRQYWALLFHDFPKPPSTILDICEDLGKSDHMLEALHWFRLGLRELLLMTLDPGHSPVFFTKQTGELRRLSRHLSPSIPLELLENLEQLERGQQRNANMQLGLEQFFFLLQEKMGMGIHQDA